MTDKRRLVFSIIQFCQKELQANDLSDDAKESLEVTMNGCNFMYILCIFTFLQVASQCLQSAYSLTAEDKHLEVSSPLETIFQEATKSEPVRKDLIS